MGTLYLLVQILVLFGTAAVGAFFTFSGTTSLYDFTCRCKGNESCTSTRGTDSGHCPLGCDDETLPWAPWSGPGCQIGNVAYKKTASLFFHQADGVHGPSHVVDGIRYGSLANGQYSKALRVSNTPDLLYAHVDLGTVHVIHTVNIHTVDGYHTQGDLYRVYAHVNDNNVSIENECTTWHEGETITAYCYNNMGRYIRVDAPRDDNELFLAEIDVRGYEYYQCSEMHDNNYWFGPACLHNCHCTQQCDVISGACNNNCKAGYLKNMQGLCALPCGHKQWGENCNNTCKCDCDVETGSCKGRTCDMGYMGENCDEECDNITWGHSEELDCHLSCNCADENEKCNKTHGNCPESGCRQWYTGTGCHYEVPRLGATDAPVKVYGNGRYVAIKFTQWHPKYGGDGTTSRMSYKLQYIKAGLSEFQDCDRENLAHVMYLISNIISCTLPAMYQNYTVRIMPYESSENYAGPGEPSQELNLLDEVSLAETQIYPYITNGVIVVVLNQLPEDNTFPVQYIIQYRQKHSTLWDQIKDPEKHIIDGKRGMLINSLYEVQVVPQTYDIANGIYRLGVASPIAEISSGCAYRFEEQFSDSCTHWCECGNRFCIKQGEHCNGVCSDCINLPDIENTQMKYSSTDGSITVSFGYSGSIAVSSFNIKIFESTLPDSSPVQEVDTENNVNVQIKHLSSSTAYYLVVTGSVNNNGKEFFSPPFAKNISTKGSNDTALVAGLVCLLVLLLAAFVIIAVLAFKLKRSVQGTLKAKDLKNKYSNVSLKNVNAAADGMYANVNASRTDAKIRKEDIIVVKDGDMIFQDKEQDVPVSIAEVETTYAAVRKTDDMCHQSRMDVEKFKAMTIENDLLCTEYSNIPENSEATTERGDLNVNYEKHRFCNIKAYDHSRVIMKKVQGDEFSDYINANYIGGYKDRKKKYVASQGPRQPTLDDMWRMIWTIDTRVIVMLTKLVEDDKVKCQQYWPDDDCISYHDIIVETIETITAAFYTKRVFLAKRGDESRQIVHLQFTLWPDHDVPDTPYELLEFYHIVKKYPSNEGQPLMVHCTAGVGRTGTFIALDYLVEQAAQENVVDVFGCVAHLRKSRYQMVQTASQYRYLHEILQSYLLSQSQMLPSKNFLAQHYQLTQEDYESSYAKLDVQKKTQLDESNCEALTSENKGKNRDERYVPSNNSRMYLTTTVPDTNSYIQAVMCHSYSQPNSLILTQVPLPATLPDIWRLAYEQRVLAIVLLDKVEDGEKYWPTDVDTQMTHGPLQITLEKEDDTLYSGMIIRKFKIQHMYHNDQIIIKQWHLIEGSSDLPSEETMSNWLLVYDQVQQYEKQQPESFIGSPTIVQCIDGCSRSGLFSVLWSVLEKLSVESVVNVDFAIRRVRKHRPQAVLDVEQYKILHELVKCRLIDQQDGYYNKSEFVNLANESAYTNL